MCSSDLLEEKLEEALLRQAQDLAHLEEALERVRPLGGPKVRRLESLIQIVREAHREGTLAQGEVERARALALELRKYLASSAVQPATLPEMVFETQEEDVLVTVEEAPALEEELVIDLESLAELLKRRAGRKVELRVPKKGEKARLLELAERNARLALETELKLRERRGEHPALKALQDLLGLPARPWRLEGYDISHLQGQARVFSIAVFEGGRPKRQEYRRMRLKAGNDDYAAMEEGVFRRYTGSLKDLPLPDLLLIDGGVGQVRAAARALERAGLRLPLVGLAKGEEVLVTPEGRELRLPLTHPALQLLIHLRDEAHQNGLRYHRKRRSEELFRVLQGIPGIGEKRRRLLLERYGGLRALKEAPLEELARLPGMSLEAARALKAALAEEEPA